MVREGIEVGTKAASRAALSMYSQLACKNKHDMLSVTEHAQYTTTAGPRRLTSFNYIKHPLPQKLTIEICHVWVTFVTIMLLGENWPMY